MYSEGKIVYFNNWAIVECDPELQEYYKWWVLKRYGVRLQGSKFGPHISLIRGDVEIIDPSIKETKWRFNDAENVKFEYNNLIRDNKDHFWIDIKSEYLEFTRIQFGLPAQPPFKLHFTIGRLKPQDLCIFN